MAICPFCRRELNDKTIHGELVNTGQKSSSVRGSVVEMEVKTTMFSCGYCHVVLGFAQFTTY